MNISFVNSLCVKNDAISNLVRDQIKWLEQDGKNKINFYSYSSDYPELPNQIVKDLKDVIFDKFFQQSNIIVFHFGVYYELFNLLPVSPVNSRKIIFFHNITPKKFVSSSSHELIDKSFAQLGNLNFSDDIFCISKFSKEFLNSFGIKSNDIIFPINFNKEIISCKVKPSFEDKITRIIFIGRFVLSKGPIDFLNCIEALIILNPKIKFKVDLIGKVSFSDPNIVQEVKISISRLKKKYSNLEINLHDSLSELKKIKLLIEADIFLLPSFHEGFCVTILEALKAQCMVLSYQNSNIISLCNGFAKLVPTGNINLLINELNLVLNQTRSSNWIENDYQRYFDKVSRYCEGYSNENIKARFLEIIEDNLQLNK